MNSGAVQAASQAFFHMRQALVEAKLITSKQACDAVYVTTLAEELRDIEAKIVTLEDAAKVRPDAPGLPGPDVLSKSLPGADWIHCKACELESRLRRIPPLSAMKTQARKPPHAGDKTWRAVPRYPKTQIDAAGREVHKRKIKD